MSTKTAPPRLNKQMPSVRTRNISTISLPDGVPPLTVPLSPFDSYWIALPPVQQLFLYSSPSLPFPSIVTSLKSSLSRILPSFHPFAGTLTYFPSTGDAAIVCSDKAGVVFIEAESDLDFDKLVADEEHDLESLLQLVPDIWFQELPAPVIAVQVTEFVSGEGGVAVGIAKHHTVTDAHGLWQFLETWAAACRTGGGVVGATPVHDRNLVRFPGSEEVARMFMRQSAPSLPKTLPRQVSILNRLRLKRRIFIFDASMIQSIKQKLTPANAGKAPSTFAALAAHGWVSFARAKCISDDNPIYACFLSDCRALLSPPVDDAYTGNCLSIHITKVTASELRGSGCIDRAFSAINKAIWMAKKEPLKGFERSRTNFMETPRGRLIVLVGSPRLRAYEMDFGWGRPARVEHVSMNHDGEIMMAAGKEADTVQVSVAIAADQMEAFAETFALKSSTLCSTGVRSRY